MLRDSTLMATLDMPQRATRRVYSAEELHSLRGSCSAPKLFEAIDEHVSEDAELVKGMPYRPPSCTLHYLDIQPAPPTDTIIYLHNRSTSFQHPYTSM